MERQKINFTNRITTIAITLTLLAGLFVPFVSPVSVKAQTVAPILVIANQGSSNPFGTFIEEMLNAEGINNFEVHPLSSLNAALLAGRNAVILAESSPTSAQITALDNYVSAGGGLIAMRPVAGLSATLGVSLQSGTTTDGYMRISDTAIGGGLYTDTMQFHGVANHFQLAGAREVARLYTTRTGATTFPAVTITDRGSGKAAMFAYDLARSIVLTRQGNPANANADRDGDGRFRTIDLFHNWADLERSRVPQADMQQRLLIRLLEEVGALPIPRLWYFPNAAPTVLVATGDNHGPNEYYGPLVNSLLAQGVPMSFYGGGPTREEVADWMAQGVEFGSHPYVDCGYECGFAEGYSAFENLYGFTPRTVRTHQVRWDGWTDAASIEAQFGVELDVNFYQWGNWLTNSTGPALGYIGGSGQPMRFIDANGNVLPIYQQHTNLVDEFLSPGVGIANLTSEQAIAASRTTIDDLVDLYYEPLVTQYHGDYYHSGTRAWVDESTRYALQRGAYALTADDWLTFIKQRAATSVSNTAWQNNTLGFDVSAGGTNQSMLIPLQIGSRLLDTIRIGGSSITYTTRIVHGRAYASIPVSTAHYTVTYTSDTTTPTVTGTAPISGASNIPLTSPMSVTFSEVMQRPATEAAFSIQPAATGVITWNSAGTTMTFTPTALLSPTSTYTATVTTGARDLAGNPLASTTSWSFTTAGATPPPSIAGVSPISGTIEGGTVVTITGASFTGATAVRFGTVAAASFTVNSDTQITATTSANPAGAVHITVTTAAGSSALTANDQFTFVDGSSTVSILGIDPATGSSNGGTNVTITGTGFQTGMTVTIGGVAATQVTVTSTTKLKATTPAHAPGVANVVVASPSNQTATLLNAFTYVNCPANCATQTSTQTFGAGSFDAGVIASETTDGEVILAPAVGSEFSGNALPANWTSTTWQTGGQSNVSNGELRADGTLVTTNEFYGPGRSIEFVATFQNAALQQHIGLATNLRDAPWAIFSTRADGAVLYARTNAGNGPQDTQLSSSWLGAPHRFRIDWTATSIIFSIDGVQVATHASAITANMRPVISDGNAGGPLLSVDWLRVDPYAPSGTFVSRVVDAGGSAAWGAMFWSTSVPNGTSASVSVRTGNTPVPDGSWTAYSTLSSSGAVIGATSRYLQYRVNLASTSVGLTPAFRDVTIAYSVSGPLSPTIDELNPSSGSTHGGTVVTITGSNYSAGATVTIGGIAATAVTVVNSTTITATTPANAAGTVDVVVTNPDGGSGTLPASFTFIIPAPIVTAISPASGTRFGGTQVTITGSNFDGATEVTFGTATATFTLESPTTITTIAPSHAAAVIDVRVRTGGGLSATSLASQYTYLDIPPPPTLTSIDPGTGPTNGGSTVTITGTNFVNGSTVTFDGTPATSVIVASSTRITAVTPAHSVGSVDVVVDTPDDQSASLANGYRYVDCSVGCVSQTTAADFRSGTVTNTFVDEEADGSVILAPAAGATFTGSALPAGWSASPWSSGGGGSVSNGSIHVDSALVATGSYFGAGGALEFVATFKSTPSQYVGLGQSLLSAPWAIFSTGRTGTSLYVLTSSPLNSGETDLGSSWLGSPHQFRIEWQANRVIYAIDGTVVASHDVAIGGQMRPVMSDWTLDSVTVDIDWIRLSPFQPSGNFTSRVLDAGGAATWTSASWSASAPAGTTLTMSVRSGNTPVPNGSWSAFSLVSGNGASISNTGRYLQYRIELTGDGTTVTPRVRDVLFTYTLGGALGPTISSLNPSSGPTGGGTSVTISGSNYAAGATVKFGGVAATAVTVVNSTTITATTPAHAAGLVDVTVTNPDGQSGILPDGYTFVPPVPVITGLSPARGALSGGTVVTISGSAFTSATAVTFGGVAATAFTVDSDTQITATSPAHAAGIVDIVVTTAGGTTSTAPAARFEYFAQSVVTVTSVDPGLGSAAGGTSIVVRGTGFQTGATVSLGGTAATNVVIVNATTITAVTAVHSAGQVNVVVTNPDDGRGTLSNGYRYVACTDGCAGDTSQADFTSGSHSNTYVSATADGEVSLAPTAGSEFSGSAMPAGWASSAWASGGNTTIAGGSASVDGALLSTTGFYSANRVLEFVATFQPGVRNQHIGFGTNLNSTPWLIFSTGGDGASLRARTHTGSTAPTADLGASWLGSPHLFRIEWTSTQIVYSIDGTVVATHAVPLNQSMRPLASDSAVGSGALVVDWMRLSPYQASGTFTSRVFNAGGAATWTSATWSASTPAGTTLSVSVRTGDTAVPNASWSAFSPVSGSGATISSNGRYLQYRIELTGGGGAVTPSVQDVLFTYTLAGVPGPVVSAVSPSSGPTGGATSVTLTGTAFATGATVTFGGIAATSVAVVNSTTITATTPAHAAGLVDVAVTNPDGQSDILPNAYSFVPPVPVISGLTPSQGALSGGTVVTISGSAFTGATAVTFGGTAADFTVDSDTQITATSPGHAAGIVDIVVTTAGGTSSTTPAARFEYFAQSEVSLTSIDPDMGSTEGGTNITIRGTGFQPDATVSLGGTAATNVVVVDASTITATTAAHSAGQVNVVVTNPDDGRGTLSNGYGYVACTDGCAGDSSQADFASGTANNTYVSATTDGEVSLAPAAGSEFSGSAMPAGWTSSAWAGGGNTTIAGGSASVDGARLSTTGFYSANRVLEFVATFQPGVRNQHAGFGTTLSSTPWLIFSTGGDGASLRARTHTGSTAPTAELGASWLGSPHLFRIEWTANQVIYSIDGTVVATHNVSISGQMRPLVSDGAVGSGALVVDWMRLSPYQASGTFTSRVFNAGGAATWTSATWSASTPAGTTLSVSVRTGDTAVPDASWSDFSPVSGSGATISSNGRYLQYRVDLATAGPGVTPTFRTIILTYETP